MVDLKHSWVRFRDLPDDLLEEMPEYVRSTFEAGRRHGFEIELLCAGAKVPVERRSKRRFVLVADDLDGAAENGPLHFDLAALACDAQMAHRMFIICAAPRPEIYAATYAAAVEDLVNGYAAAVVVETRTPFAQSWARTLSALQNGGVADMSQAACGKARHRVARS